MTNKSRTRRQLQKVFAQKQSLVSQYIGILGDGVGNVKDTRFANHVFARISGIVISVFNTKVPPENDLKVVIGKDVALMSSPMQVLSTYSVSPGGTTGGGVTGYAPASQYEWLGPDPIFIDKRLLLPRRISSYSGMLVKMYPDMFRTGSAYISLSEQTVDLTSYIATTPGKMVLVLFTLDSSGTLVETASGEVDIFTATPTDIPEPPSGTADVLACVRCYYGQTEVQETITNTDILDLRYTYFGAGEVGPVAFTDLSDTFEYDGLGGEYVKVKSTEDGLETGTPPAPPASTKLTELTETTTPALTDIIYIVVDPGSMPLSRFTTLQNLKTALGVGDVVGKYRQFLYTVVSGNPTFLTDGDGNLLTVALDLE
jgi:hypothetical protein